MQLLAPLVEAGFPTYLIGPSALDIYFGRRRRGANGGADILWVETEASLVDLTRLFDGITFPGAEFFDAALDSALDSAHRDGRTLVLFRCVEPGEAAGEAQSRGTLQGSFRFEIGRGVFQDPCTAYPHLRSANLQLLTENAGAETGAEKGAGAVLTILEAALLIARFGYKPPDVPGGTAEVEQPGHLSSIEQRFLLTGVLTGGHSAAALQFLMDSGFISAYWPLLEHMDGVHHSKEDHPEGNVWKHTLETFTHRKVYELELGLGLLLHDCGKPYARAQGGNRFDQHSQIGAQKTRRFLEDLQFPQRVIASAEYLVKHHMMPSAIPSLPTFRTQEVMASPLFPELLELYRCDVSATFRGPDGYYRACKTYRSFLKHQRNPFRSSDGKKRLRLLVE
ncbi:MAG: HD domain-containing protein [Spirochaetia bacterium]|nr:HD domain-containing protein [Spirochaetia bacterium]